MSSPGKRNDGDSARQTEGSLHSKPPLGVQPCVWAARELLSPKSMSLCQLEIMSSLQEQCCYLHHGCNVRRLRQQEG